MEAGPSAAELPTWRARCWQSQGSQGTELGVGVQMGAKWRMINGLFWAVPCAGCILYGWVVRGHGDGKLRHEGLWALPPCSGLAKH